MDIDVLNRQVQDLIRHKRDLEASVKVLRSDVDKLVGIEFHTLERRVRSLEDRIKAMEDARAAAAAAMRRDASADPPTR